MPAWTRALPYALALATLVAAVLLRVPSLSEPRWYGDEGIFAAIAQNLRDGRTLYADAWDNKPPLIFLTYAAIQAVFGNSVAALHAVTSVVVLGTQVVVMAVAVLISGVRRAWLAGLTFALLMSTPIIEGNLAMTETYMVLPTTLAMLVFVLAMRREEEQRDVLHVAAGLLLSVAASYKQVAVFDALALICMIWLTHAQPLRASALLVAGLGVPQVMLLGVFAALGALGEYWYAVVGSLGLYSELADSTGPFERFAGVLPALLIMAVLVRRKQQGGEVTVRDLPALWLGFALAGATSSGFEFPHYLQQAAPAAALLVASVDVRAYDTDSTGRAAAIAAALLVVAVIFGQFATAFSDRKQLRPWRYYRYYLSQEFGTMSDLDYDLSYDGKAVAVNDIERWIRADGAGDTLFAWSELPWIYAAAEMKNPARFYTSFLGEVVPDARPEIMRDLQADAPVYIVVSEDTYAPFPELEPFIEAHYGLLQAQGDWRLYRNVTAGGRLPLLEPSEAAASDDQPARRPPAGVSSSSLRSIRCSADCISSSLSFDSGLPR